MIYKWIPPPLSRGDVIKITHTIDRTSFVEDTDWKVIKDPKFVEEKDDYEITLKLMSKNANYTIIVYLSSLEGNYTKHDTKHDTKQNTKQYRNDGIQHVGGKKSKRSKKYKRNNKSRKSRKVKRKRKNKI